MKQKYSKLTFVKVADEMPPYMSHFDKGFIGIVDGTYSQIYGGEDINQYALYKTENGKIVNRISWYYENQLTPTEEQDKVKAEEMIEQYNFGNANAQMGVYCRMKANRLNCVVIRKITDIAEQALKEWKTKIYSDDGAEKDAIYEKMVDIQVNNFTVYLLKQIESNFSV